LKKTNDARDAELSWLFKSTFILISSWLLNPNSFHRSNRPIVSPRDLVCIFALDD
jgi:hypothetical protein